ncbi:hypothetical protein B0G84_7715 [Paraburkholderia sp. BL8N3]|nr:hypothetical protein [Paraburkholderia sp. BL8N3]TCK33477.1 hypothetical protein B0G84_7715 [Paraburkholderia sp. BL8N3]
MTDEQVATLKLGRDTFQADVQSIARVIVQRHLACGAEPTWQLLRDIVEETLCDLGLISQWGVEPLQALVATLAIPSIDGSITRDAGASLTGLSAYLTALLFSIADHDEGWV